MLQEFDTNIRDKKGKENVVADHFSRLIDLKAGELPIDDFFPNDKLFLLVGKETRWYANYVNYLVAGVLPLDIDYQCKSNFFLQSQALLFGWDSTFLERHRCSFLKVYS